MKRHLRFIIRMAAFAAASFVISVFGGAYMIEACLDPQASGVIAALGFIAFWGGFGICAYSLHQAGISVKAMAKRNGKN